MAAERPDDHRSTPEPESDAGGATFLEAITCAPPASDRRRAEEALAAVSPPPGAAELVAAAADASPLSGPIAAPRGGLARRDLAAAGRGQPRRRRDRGAVGGGRGGDAA